MPTLYKRIVTPRDPGLGDPQIWSYIPYAEYDTDAEVLRAACALNAELPGVRAAWNNAKQHYDDFAYVFTTHDRHLLTRVYFAGVPPIDKIRCTLDEADVRVSVAF